MIVTNHFAYLQKITTELKEKGDSSRATPTDIVGLISKHFEGKLSAVEWDELKLDPGLCQSFIRHT